MLQGEIEIWWKEVDLSKIGKKWGKGGISEEALQGAQQEERPNFHFRKNSS
jgi:hypothetical protein